MRVRNSFLKPCIISFISRAENMLLIFVLVLIASLHVTVGIADELLPAEFDWHEKGIMTPVKHQGECGSCGEFAAVAVFEALIKKETGITADLSEQQVIDCVPGCGCNTGCSSLAALEYIKEKGITTENNYPYKGEDTPCDFKHESEYFLSEVKSTIVHGHDLKERVQIIKKAVRSFGPVATNMCFYEDLDRYKSDIYFCDENSKEMGGHWVVIVGWADDTGIKSGGYWICRNSWGDKWGEGGYFRSAYGEAGIDDFYIVYAIYNPASGASPE